MPIVPSPTSTPNFFLSTNSYKIRLTKHKNFFLLFITILHFKATVEVPRRKEEGVGYSTNEK